METWHLLGHLLIALLISAFIYSKTKKVKYIFLCIFISFAIDVDHFFDYWIAYGFNLNLVKFFDLDFFKINGKVFVPFHSWELIATILLLSKFIEKYNVVLLIIGLAVFGHVLWDMISYKIAIIDYSLIYRAMHSFQVECRQ